MPIGSDNYINWLTEFLQRYPLIELDIIESDSYSNLIESRCDIALRASASLEDSALYATEIGQFNDVFCASPTYLQRFEQITSAQDLLKLDWISHKIVHGDKQLVLTNSQGEVVKLITKPQVQVRTTQSMKNFLKNHVGFGILPNFAIHEELESGELVRLLPQVHDYTISMYAVYQDKAYMQQSTRTLIDFLKEKGGTLR